MIVLLPNIDIYVFIGFDSKVVPNFQTIFRISTSRLLLSLICKSMDSYLRIQRIQRKCESCVRSESNLRRRCIRSFANPANPGFIGSVVLQIQDLLDWRMQRIQDSPDSHIHDSKWIWIRFIANSDFLDLHYRNPRIQCESRKNWIYLDSQSAHIGFPYYESNATMRITK